MLILGKNINQQKVLCKIDRAITSEPRVCVSMSLLSSFRPKVQFFGQFILKCWHVCCTHPLSWIWEDTGIIQLILSLIIQLNDIYRQTASHGIWLASFTEVVFHFHITVVLLFPAPSPHYLQLARYPYILLEMQRLCSYNRFSCIPVFKQITFPSYESLLHRSNARGQINVTTSLLLTGLSKANRVQIKLHIHKDDLLSIIISEKYF